MADATARSEGGRAQRHRNRQTFRSIPGAPNLIRSAIRGHKSVPQSDSSVQLRSLIRFSRLAPLEPDVLDAATRKSNTFTQRVSMVSGKVKNLAPRSARDSPLASSRPINPR